MITGQNLALLSEGNNVLKNSCNDCQCFLSSSVHAGIAECGAYGHYETISANIHWNVYW